MSKTSSADGALRQPTRWTRTRLLLAVGVIFLLGGIAAALNLEFVVGKPPRKVKPNSLLVLDPHTLETLANVARPGPRPPNVVRGAGLLWTVDGERDRVVATNPFSKRVFRTQVVGSDPVAVAVGFGAAWVANAGNGSITRVPIVGDKVETIGLGDQPSAVATGAGYVWVLSRRSRKVLRLDPKTKQVTRTVRLTNPPLAVAVRSPHRVAVAIGD